MQINGTLHGNARTYLTHLFGQGLDDLYVVQRYKSDYEGRIRPWRRDKGSKCGREQARKVMNLRAVQRLRPERDAGLCVRFGRRPPPQGAAAASLAGHRETQATNSSGPHAALMTNSARAAIPRRMAPRTVRLGPPSSLAGHRVKFMRARHTEARQPR